MNKSSLFAVAIAFSLVGTTATSFAHSEGHPTSLGTSRNRTVGGTNAVKLSVMRGSTIGAAKEIVASIYNRPIQYLHANGNYYETNTDLRTMLTNGFKIAHKLPAELAGEASRIEVRPWAAGEPHVFSKHVTGAVAMRLSSQAAELLRNADRLHAKGEITDVSLQHAKFIGGLWHETAKYFAQSEEILAKNRVSVELDQ
ncbi:MAG: hypothetical protein ABI321_00765 [Polyangia bacterium]